eukprot:15481715-Alexandrium_andersonii.AAC.1
MAAWKSRGRSMVLFIDANTRLGPTCTKAVGSYGSEEDSEFADRFRTTLGANSLALPSTFAECAGGIDNHTWVSSQGTKHRIDYIAIPSQWMGKNPKLQDPELFDLTMTRADHLPVILSVDIDAERGPVFHQRKRPA